MAEQQTYYRPGLIFLSNAAGYVLHARDAKYHTYPGGERELDRPALVADFAEGTTGGFNRLIAEDGKPINLEIYGVEGYSMAGMSADMRGGAFDLDAAAQRSGWTEEEREWVARKMLTMDANPQFNGFWLYRPAVPSAPWPTYDETHHFKIPTLAQESGLVAEAIAYEAATKNREGVLKALAEKIGEAKVEEELTVV